VFADVQLNARSLRSLHRWLANSHNGEGGSSGLQAAVASAPALGIAYAATFSVSLSIERGLAKTCLNSNRAGWRSSMAR